MNVDVGTIGLSVDESSWPDPKPPFRHGAPNVLVIVLDDTGFGQLGCYGSDIETPNLDALAERGVRFTNFHTTAICSPTRACLLTGRNHHRVGMGYIPDIPMRFPGYTGRVAQILGGEGWATYAVGKWHMTPRDERTRSGPFGTWPLGAGFERFYGFLGGDANHWAPELVRDNSFVDPPCGPDEGYHLTEDLADQAITYIRELRNHQPNRPFLCWFGLGATHAPHHVAPEWSDRYAGSFDGGWDRWRESVLARQKEIGIVPSDTQLSERPGWLTPWDDLGEDERRLYARMMEIYAGFLTHTDHQIGRLFTSLDEMGELDNTIVIVVSDNGASGEGGPHGSLSEYEYMYGLERQPDELLARIDDLGGPRSYNHYPWAWAHAGNTPFRRFKRYTFEGGVRDPFIFSWPAGEAEQGSIRSQYAHAVDVLPTLLDCLGVEFPDQIGGVGQMSVDGASFRATLSAADAEEHRRTQYYECWGSRAIYDDGWKAVTNHVNQYNEVERESIDGSADFHADRWALYDTRTDFVENHDLADAHPERLQHLVDLWNAEADRNQVLPLTDATLNRFPHILIPWSSGARSAELRPGERLSEESCPSFAGGVRLTAHFSAPLTESVEGILAEQGDYNNGWAWYVQDGEVVFVLNHIGEALHRVSMPVPVGAERMSLIARPSEGGMACEWTADGVGTGAGTIPVAFPLLWSPNSSATLLVGEARQLPVCDDYVPPFPFSDVLASVRLETDRRAILDPQAQLDTARRHQ